MSRDLSGADIIIRIGIAVVFGFASYGITRCTSETDIVKKPDGTCDISTPRSLKYRTSESCGKNCSRTLYHEFGVAQNSKNNVQLRYKMTKTGYKITREFDYEPNGITLEARLTTQTKAFYRSFPNPPKTRASDIGVHDTRVLTTFGNAHQSGFEKAIDLIERVEEFAGCKMPKPARIGIAGTDFQVKSDW